MNERNDFLHLMEVAKLVVEDAEINAKENPSAGDTVTVVIIEPQKEPYQKEMDNSLEAMQEIVGGWIESVGLERVKRGARISLIMNEEGKMAGLPFNRKINDLGILVGTIFITKHNSKGDTVSLSDEECKKYIKLFKPMEIHL